MKTTIAIVMLAIVGGIIYLSQLETSFTATNVQETEVIDLTPEWATDVDAVKAAQDVIHKKGLVAELSQLESEVVVIKEEAQKKVDEKEVRIVELQKELNLY